MDNVQANIEKIQQLFPNAVTEVLRDGKTALAVDWDVLRQEMSDMLVEGNEERYQFTWPDKRKSILVANTPTTATLRPVRERSVNFDTTQNLYIEGDNLEVLKLLQETYLGKIKMIYIDPPYNTGNDFVYEDDFAQDAEGYIARSGQYDEEGNRLVQNTESNGRFHTDWLNMLYPRLRIAKDLLADDGVICISIDDHEQAALKQICSEIFGDNNFIAQIIWERAYAPVNLKKHFSESHDYILFYAKNIESTICNGLPKTGEALDRYKNPDNDPRGPWKAADSTVGPAIAERVYPITLPSGRIVVPSSGRCWLYTPDKFKELEMDNRIWYGPNGDSTPAVKKFASEVKQTMTPMTIWKYSEVGHSQDAAKKLMLLFDGQSYFDYPKSVDLISRCIQLYATNDSIILDFFSGSATTAHAVMQLNAEDGGHRKFIMVQLPEVCDEKSEAYKAGYRTICDIGEERIRRAGKKIVEEQAHLVNAARAGAFEQGTMFAEFTSSESAKKTQAEVANNLDIGFRVLRVDSSNMKDVYYTPHDTQQSLLDSLESNIKEDRTDEDLLFQVMLSLGKPLSAKIERKEIVVDKRVVDNITSPYSLTPTHYTIYCVDGNDLVCCFDQGITGEVVRAIADMHPLYAVFRDSSMGNDDLLANFDQIFATYSPNTDRRVL